MRTHRTSRRSLVALAWALSLVLASGAAWLAGRSAFVPSAPVDSAPVVATVEVEEVTVGATSTFTATATWPARMTAPAGFGGTVTSVDVLPGSIVDVGSLLFSVDLSPVVAATGGVPAFRDLGVGATGADVEQLEWFLQAGGWLRSVDDDFTTSTASAVKSWQRSRGLEPTGSVGVGDLLFVPLLPARVSPSEGLRVGARIAAGDDAVQVMADAPTVALSVGTDIQTPPTTGQSVTVHADSGDIPAVVAGSSVTDIGTTTFQLTGPSGGDVCARPCEVISFDVGTQTFPATVVLAPLVSGPGVPLAALWTDSNGQVQVTMADGLDRQVTVLASDRSRAVLDGLSAGDVVRLFGEPAMAEPTAAAAGGATG